jgi:hypothetical protein
MDEHLFVFADLHYAIAAAAGSFEDAQRFVQSCSAFADSRSGTQASVMEKVGLAIVRAIAAHRRAAYAEAVELLLPHRKEIHQVGGSHAQRDTFEQLLIDSALRARNYQQARLLLMERTAARPHDIWAWKVWANVAEAIGDREAAAMASMQIASLLGERV